MNDRTYEKAKVVVASDDEKAIAAIGKRAR